jgi:hypothetical protein
MVCVTRKWAGVDNAWEQEKLEATLREMNENAAEIPASSAHFVSLFLAWVTSLLTNQSRNM